MQPPDTIIDANVRAALEEDLGAPLPAGLSGDLTARLLPETALARARVITRDDAILAGTAWFSRCFKLLDPDSRILWQASDAEDVQAGQTLCEIEGQARALLSAERPALNFLQTLSGVATATRDYVAAVAGTRAKIHDTRKTVPGLRIALKFAVQCGGGENQRIGLYDGILIKENHIAAAGSVTAAVRNAQALVAAQASPLREQITIQVEVETLDELREALAAEATSVLLDNFSLAMMREAVRINQELAQGRALLEVSGGVTLEQLRGIAETGVDRISIGKLTKDVKAVDFSMRVLGKAA